MLQQSHGVPGSGEDSKGTSSHTHDGGHQHESRAVHHLTVQPGGQCLTVAFSVRGVSFCYVRFLVCFHEVARADKRQYDHEIEEYFGLLIGPHMSLVVGTIIVIKLRGNPKDAAGINASYDFAI